MSGQYNHELKLDRAREHMRSLDTEWRRWREGEPYSFIHEPDTDTSEYVIKVQIFEQPPARFALILGDCVYNIRAALDNLAYELAVAAHKGQPLPMKVADGSAFPICITQRAFRSQRKGKIGGMVPRAQATIQMLQPYRRWNKGTSDPLWLIDRLSNVDKHRLPHFQLMLPAGAVFTDGALGVMRSVRREAKSGPVEHGAVMARYVRIADVPDEEMDMHFSPLLSIGFGDSLPVVKHQSAFKILPRLIDYLEDAVFPLLTPYL
jgi:hypothetical protein